MSPDLAKEEHSVGPGCTRGAHDKDEAVSHSQWPGACGLREYTVPNKTEGTVLTLPYGRHKDLSGPPESALN